MEVDYHHPEPVPVETEIEINLDEEIVENPPSQIV